MPTFSRNSGPRIKYPHRHFLTRFEGTVELIIGSNTIRDTSGVLNVEGEDQIFLEVGEDGQLLLTMDVYNEQGEHVAKLRRNAWAFNEGDRYEVTTDPSSLKLTDGETGDLLVEARVEGRDEIVIPRGRFFTHAGHLLEITPDYWSVAGGLKMSDCVIDSCGGAVAIG